MLLKSSKEELFSSLTDSIMEEEPPNRPDKNVHPERIFQDSAKLLSHLIIPTSFSLLKGDYLKSKPATLLLLGIAIPPPLRGRGGPSYELARFKCPKDAVAKGTHH